MDTSLRVPDQIRMEDIPPYEFDDYDLFDEKDFRKYLNDVKRFVRNSFEYRKLVQYMKQNMNMNECSAFEGLNMENFPKVKIELHHSPFCLEDIVATIYNKRSFYGESLEVEDVAKEVVYLHYFMMVGLIPLSSTVHELVHSQNFFIPTTKVEGDYKEFIETYKNWMEPDLLEKINAIEEKTLYLDEKENLKILEPNQIPVNMIDTTQQYLIPSMENMNSLMNKKLEEIRNQNKYSLPDNNYYDNNIIDEPKYIKGMTYYEEDTLIRGMTYDETYI